MLESGSCSGSANICSKIEVEQFCYKDESPLAMGNIGTAYSAFKPRAGSLARVLLEKQRADQYLSSYDKNQVSNQRILLLFFI